MAINVPVATGTEMSKFLASIIIQTNTECKTRDAANCTHLLRFKYIMNRYSNDMKRNIAIFSEYLSVILDDYFHLLSKHNDEQSFETIFNSLKLCNINKCIILNRNYRDRINSNNDNNIAMYPIDDDNDIIL
eukprot:43418_1